MRPLKQGILRTACCILALAAAAACLRAQEPATPNLAMLKTDLLVVTAHPDDEGMMAATMARYADQGKVVALVTCTHGEGGGNGTGKESGAALGIVREAELRRCLDVLGTRYLYFLNQPDWAYTESVQATLAKWGHDESLRRLARLVRLLRPEVICTMDPAPVGGQHGHHQAAGRLATEVFETAADPNAFPDLIRYEGLAPWRARKLYWSSFGGGSTLQLATDGVAKGALAAMHPDKTYSEIATAAERNHRSQGFDKFLAAPAAGATRAPARPDGFLLVKSRVRIDPISERDLFDGIAGANFNGPDTRHDVLVARLPAAAPGAAVEAHLRPRNNVVNYREWLKKNGISRLMTRLPARVTVVQGAADNPIEVEVTNHTGQQRSGVVSLRAPEGWIVERQEMPYSLPAHSAGTVRFRCKPPATAAVGSYDATVRIGSATDAGKLDLVPSLVIPRLSTPLPVDTGIAKWEQAKVAPTPIPPTNLVQGVVRGPQECSGRFFAGYDSEGLQVLVDVTDDTVARNIAPDDIKAHWRSTSVELCVDPQPRSENTFTTFKLGIFPQDTTGRVRAARDADAHPGELAQIHSNIRLASKLTPQGYLVEARIPWAELNAAPGRASMLLPWTTSTDFRHTRGVPSLLGPDLRYVYRPIRGVPSFLSFGPGKSGSVAPGRALGFNVILYHAGKKEARVGEDIGKSRLAWSFWPGVPGRPEVWGMAYLR